MSSGTEPVSGQLGNTAAGEPYDAGNMSGIPSSQSHLSQPASASASYSPETSTPTTAPAHQHPTHDRPLDNSTASRTSGPNAHLNAISSAGRHDHDSTLEHAGGIQSTAGSALHPTTHAPTHAATHHNDVDDAAAQGPPAPKLTFTGKEIDDAANVNRSHESPHTIGPDGKEESLEESGGYHKTDDATAHEGKEGKTGKTGQHKEGMGQKMEHLKEKVLHKH